MGENIQNKEQNDSMSGSMAVLHTLQVTEGMEGLDQASKELYKHKEVLAIILKGVVREYEAYSYPEIMDFIERDSITDTEVVSPGHSDIDNRITGDDKEFIALREKLSQFDAKFRALNPELSGKDITVNLHIDIEPQKEYKPGYPIEKRGIYYLARELSSQLSLVTEDTNYSSLSKCYSIFICRDGVPEDERFSISVIEMSNTQNYGKCHPKKEDYDLLTLVIIRLGDQIFREMEIDEKEKAEEYTDKNGMLEFLHAIMYPHKDNFLETVKKYIDFSENKELWREVDQMTGLGMKIGEECWEEGRQVGWNEGRQSGWDEGQKSGIELGATEKEKSIAFRMFSRNNPLENVSDTLGISMDYTIELHQQYEHMVHEESKYGEK